LSSHRQVAIATTMVAAIVIAVLKAARSAASSERAT
jgi:hypothetical protein